VEEAQEGEVASAGGPIPGVGRVVVRVGGLGSDGRSEEEVAEVPLDEVHGEEAAGGNVINEGVEGGGRGAGGRGEGDQGDVVHRWLWRGR